MSKFLLRLALIVVLVPTPAWAVSCGGPTSVREAFAKSDNVFLAYVEELYTGSGFGKSQVGLAGLRILHVWKGDLQLGSTVSASAENTISFIGDGLVPIQHSGVIVYASGEQPFLLHTCSRTQSLEWSVNDIPLLNSLSKRAQQRGR